MYWGPYCPLPQPPSRYVLTIYPSAQEHVSHSESWYPLTYEEFDAQEKRYRAALTRSMQEV